MFLQLLRYWQHTLGYSPDDLAELGQVSKRTIERWIYEKKTPHHGLFVRLYRRIRAKHAVCLARIAPTEHEDSRYAWFSPVDAILPLDWNVTLWSPSGAARWCLVYEFNGEIYDVEFDQMPIFANEKQQLERLAEHAERAIQVYHLEVTSAEASASFCSGCD